MLKSSHVNHRLTKLGVNKKSDTICHKKWDQNSWGIYESWIDIAYREIGDGSLNEKLRKGEYKRVCFNVQTQDPGKGWKRDKLHQFINFTKSSTDEGFECLSSLMTFSSTWRSFGISRDNRSGRSKMMSNKG